MVYVSVILAYIAIKYKGFMMSIQPNFNLNFQPTCRSFRCFCCAGETDEMEMYPCKDAKFKPVAFMYDADIEKANMRFRQIIIRKLDPLPLDTDDFIDRLENEEGVSLEVSREKPLTRCRLENTIKAINRMLGEMHVE